jgi:transposase
MLSISPKHKIYLAVSHIDFRRGIDSIARLCKNLYQQDPMQGHYFVFLNKRRNSIKILYYDSQGFCLLQKRLSQGRFLHWPTHDNEVISLTSAQFQVLLYNGNPQNTNESPAWKKLNSPR